MISSRNNPTIKHIRSLRDRKERERSGHFFIEGIRIVAEAIEEQSHIEQLIIAPDLLTSQFGLQFLESAEHLPRLEVTADVFKSVSLKDGPQGIGAVMRQRWEQLEQVRLEQELCWVALDAIQDPGNLGTILRTLDAVDGGGVILLGHTTDPYDPTAVRASMGALFSQRLVRTSFADFVAWKRQHNYALVGTSGTASVHYRAVAYRRPLVLLLGSEQHGLSREQQASCDMMVYIPMVGRSDSLNLAVATGVVLYEIYHQQNPVAPALPS